MALTTPQLMLFGVKLKRVLVYRINRHFISGLARGYLLFND
jgi:hypothetical protein